MYLNKVTLIGNLTRDPELKALPSGTKVANFSIATNRTWKDKDGVKKEDCEFHNCVAFGRTAEVICEWVHKGDQIYVEGRLKTSNWEKEGVKHYKTEINVETFQFGSQKAKNSPKTNEKPKDEDTIEYPSNEEIEAKTGTEEINPNDIPF